MKRLSIVLVLLLLFAFPHQVLSDDYKDGMKAYKNGDLFEAMELFIGQVLSKPKHKKSINMIKEVLPLVIDLRKSRAQKYEAEERWDKAQKEYTRLEKLGKVIKGLEAYIDKQRVVWPDVDVGTAQKDAAADNSAEIAYQKGVEAMATPGSAEEAIEFFKVARKYDPDYKDAKDLGGQALYNDGMALVNEGDYKGGVRILWKLRDFFPDGFKDSEEQVQAAIDSGKVKIAIMPFDDLTFKDRFGDVGMMMSSEIISAGVQTDPIFIDFVTRDYVYSLMSEQEFGESDRVDAATAKKLGKLIGIDVFVFGRITAVTSHYPNVTKSNSSNSERIYIGDNKYRTVSANWTLYTRQGKVTVSANYQILDIKTGRIIDSNSFKKTKSSVAKWAVVRGNADAVPNHIKHLPNSDTSVEPPETLANYAVTMVSKEIAASILENYEE